MRARCILLTLCILAVTGPLLADTWVRGALMLHRISGEIVLTELGGTSVDLASDDAPLTLPGLFNCQAAHAASAFFSTSNRSYILFEGDGSFAVERFEQVLPDSETWWAGRREASQSRMIVHFRSGQMTLDSRNMSDASQYLVETPLGRISARRALWQMRIAFDPRSQIFDFTISCSDGRVRFTDLQGQQYTLRTGQRLSGAGARTAPSIEVAGMAERVIEQMQRFLSLVETFASTADDLQSYEPHFEKIAQAEPVPTVTPQGLDGTASDRRPLVIEYAKEPAPVTPFRGEVRPPSSFQADLF
jgi:hypothetical protein